MRFFLWTILVIICAMTVPATANTITLGVCGSDGCLIVEQGTFPNCQFGPAPEDMGPLWEMVECELEGSEDTVKAFRNTIPSTVSYGRVHCEAFSDEELGPTMVCRQWKPTGPSFPAARTQRQDKLEEAGIPFGHGTEYENCWFAFPGAVQCDVAIMDKAGLYARTESIYIQTIGFIQPPKFKVFDHLFCRDMGDNFIHCWMAEEEDEDPPEPPASNQPKTKPEKKEQEERTSQLAVK